MFLKIMLNKHFSFGCCLCLLTILIQYSEDQYDHCVHNGKEIKDFSSAFILKIVMRRVFATINLKVRKIYIII